MTTQRRQWFAVAAIVTALGGLLLVFTISVAAEGSIGPGTRAPDFLAINVQTSDTVTLADYVQQVVLVNVWATWCRPCEEEMPSMQRLYERLGPEGLRIAAVSIDTDSPAAVRQWAADRHLTFDILHDRRGRIQRLYQTTGVPESFIVDQHGVIIKRQIGAYEWDQPTSVATFRRLLAPAGQPAASPGDKE